MQAGLLAEKAQLQKVLRRAIAPEAIASMVADLATDGRMLQTQETFEREREDGDLYQGRSVFQPAICSVLAHTFVLNSPLMGHNKNSLSPCLTLKAGLG